jgi:DNA-binding NarL/FixJ family response regulator
LEVLKLVAEGNRYKRIGVDLYVSEMTVHREMQAIFDWLGVNDAAHAVSETYRLRIIA